MIQHLLKTDFRLLRNVIGPEEERLIYNFFMKKLDRLCGRNGYKDSHFDNVIHRYRETSYTLNTDSNSTEADKVISQLVKDFILPTMISLTFGEVPSKPSDEPNISSINHETLFLESFTMNGHFLHVHILDLGPNAKIDYHVDHLDVTIEIS
jgi:hypothetical protein